MQQWITQFRKGLVELCVLAVLRDDEAYGYQIVERLSQVPGLEVTESTVYPVLARLARRVYTIERYRTLVGAADLRLQALKITNVTSMPGDGSAGWPAQAPFDRIMVTAAADEVPKALIKQLAPGGVMIIPVGAAGGDQRLFRIDKNMDGKVTEKPLMAVRFVPLVSGRASSL